MIIVALTTIKSRLDGLPAVIDSLCNQTCMPDVIHIFYSTSPLLLDEGITNIEMNRIIACARACATNAASIKIEATPYPNIGPYRKLFPALELYGHEVSLVPNIIITVDDDHVFSPTFISQFMEVYEKYGCIVCSAAKRADLKLADNTKTSAIGAITLPYVDPTTMPMLHLIPEGFGGILYDTKMWSSECPNMPVFDVICNDPIILTNDDIFLRLCTFKRGIRVMLINVDKNQDAATTTTADGLYNNYNKSLTTNAIIAHINQTPFMQELDNLYHPENIIDMIDEVYTARELTNIRHSFKMGTDIKLLQYERNVGLQDTSAIALIPLLETGIRASIPANATPPTIGVFLINIEKDLRRYGSAVEELKKLTIPTFTHLKATYWRDREQFADDLNKIVDYLHMYAEPTVPATTTNTVKIEFDAFSMPTDLNIHIQDGPLACYCSHLRAMICGQLHNLDAIIICEDDMLVANTHKIAKYVAQIPDDWDIITFNSVPIGIDYGTAPWYKMQGRFYSTHFYIVRCRALPTIFRHMYPITDQVDILLSKLHDQLAIYNVVDTIYQKNYSTNTQNNLWVIYNSAGYEPIRAQLRELGELYEQYIGRVLYGGQNPMAAKRIATNAIADVLFEYIMANSSSLLIGDIVAPAPAPAPAFEEAARIYELLHVIINCCVKGIGIHKVVTQLMADIQNIVECFSAGVGAADGIEPYAYGSTANVFIDICDNTVLKQYNTAVRWAAAPENHRNASDIFTRELQILQTLQQHGSQRLTGWDTADLALKLVNLGESLYECFILPGDWREQLQKAFAEFTEQGIYYSEFNLKNIVYNPLSNTINLIDFGLAACDAADAAIATKNGNACTAFIELLEMLEAKLGGEKDSLRAKILYKTFINNLRINPNKYSSYIF